MSGSALQRILPVVAVWTCRLLPPVITVLFFMIIYNNTTQGRADIIGMIVLQAAFLIFLAVTGSRSPLVIPLKVGSICSLAFLGTIFALELLFPIVMPGEYSHIRDLSKRQRSYSAVDRNTFTVVFDNRVHPQTRFAAYPGEELRSPVASRRIPDADSKYYGYEPNEGYSYINIITRNGHGYFDRYYSYAKPSGTFRIVIVGDSYVVANQVPLHRAFHKLLESMLNRSDAGTNSTHERFQVIALGKSGTGQKLHAQVMREEALRYAPDLVVLSVCDNDFCDDSPELSRERNLATGAVTPALRSVARHGWYSAAFAIRQWEQWQARLVSVSPEVLQWSAESIPRVERAWKETLTALGESHEICRSRGIKFAVMYVGSDVEVRYRVRPRETLAALDRLPGIGPDFQWDVEKTVKRIRGFCSSRYIPFVSLMEPLAEAQKRTGLLVFGDHYTMFGHLIAAEALKNSLNPLLPPARSVQLSHALGFVEGKTP